jgi:pimeloyl-ACP methyl ester carboxylesterase
VTKPWEDIFYTARDGLRLYARRYGTAATGRRPLVCLAGLTRNHRDFHDLALALSDPANPAAREVYAVDARGRGRSQHDPDWRNYAVQVETMDVLDFLDIRGLAGSAVLGTSRGGILALLMAVLRPTAIGVAVFNDIGPVIEREGLLRIVAYVGRVPLPATWPEAAALVRDLNRRQFPAVLDHHWEAVARQWFDDENGRPAHGYDQALAKAATVMDAPPPVLWPQFDALLKTPTLVLRGEHSDILSAATVDEMRRRHPNLEAITVRGQGHAPLLRDNATQSAIAEFLTRHD